MIPLLSYNQFLTDAQQAVNTLIEEYNRTETVNKISKPISGMILSVNEAHAIKKLKDTAGVVMLAKMYDADTRTDGSRDNYAELNHALIYLIEKTDPSGYTVAQETEQWAMYQKIMSLLKTYILERKVCDTRLDKPFHTEWEYNVFGGYNGLSVSFDLKEYTL